MSDKPIPNASPDDQGKGELPTSAGELSTDLAQTPVDPRPHSELEREVAQWASANRNAFPNRRDFNLALCDKLAARGIPPTAGALRRLGGKGTSNSQTEDVQHWFTALAARLNTMEAQIPLGARRQANTLVEQLWLAARHEVDNRVAAPLRAELASAQEALDTAAGRLRELEASLAAEADRSNRLTEELHNARTHAQEAADRAEAELQAAKATLEAANREHADALGRISEEMNQDRERFAAEIRQLHDRNANLVRTSAEERARLLQQVDQERQGAREWQTRHDTQDQRRAQLQERLEILLESEARAVAARDSALEQVQALRARTGELELAAREASQVAGELRERLAVAEERVTQQQARVHDLETALEAGKTPKKRGTT
jgi:chromosome segregation protein